MNNPLDLDAVIDQVRRTLAHLLATEVDAIEADSRLIEDLSADSLDIVDLSFQLGKHFGCTLPKSNVIDHAAEMCGSTRAFFDANGLTPLGSNLLQQSLNGFTPEQLRIGMSQSAVVARTTVRNWANLCYHLFDHLPSSCPECGATQATVNALHQAVCADCAARLTPPEGDDIVRSAVAAFVLTHMQAVDAASESALA